MNVLYLKPGRDKSLLRLHPWVFSGSIAKLDGNPEMGETVEIRDAHGHFLAWGAYSPESQIKARVWSWNPQHIIGPDLFYPRLVRAMGLRVATLGEGGEQSDSGNYTSKPTLAQLPSAVRLVHAESDGLPGLIVDRYGDILVVQFLSAGAEHWRDLFIEMLLELTDAEHIFERSDADVRQLEGLPARVGPLFGTPAEQLSITEHGLRFVVNLLEGQKTGFYLDQRRNRLRLRELANSKDVLDCFSYSGGFALNALAGDAKSVVAVDTSSEALELARENVELNSLPMEKVEWLQEDVFKQLRKFRDEGRQFDLVVLDPPKFAPTSSLVQQATRGYKDINLLAFKLLRPGGILMTFSCSGGVSPELFQKIVAWAALDAGVNAHIISHLEQSPDHPVNLSFPEGAYLKGLVIRVG